MMSIYGGYKTKKAFKEACVGKSASGIFQETSIFGAEYKGDGKYAVVGPTPHERKWFASVVVLNGNITKIS